MKLINVDFFLGKTIKHITTNSADGNVNELIFTFDNDEQVIMFHESDCCEIVYLYDIVGELDDLVNSPILMAEEVSNTNESRELSWTYYKLATVQGYVTLSWRGESNGYYTMDVNLYLIEEND
jgi:hypothetical protein